MRVYGPCKFDDQRLRLGEIPIGVFTAQLAYDEGELEGVIDICRRIWHFLLQASGIVDFHGLIRFDGVPSFVGANGDYLGRLMLRALYEVNTNAPECGMASAMFSYKYPDMPSINTAALIALQMNMYQEGKEPIAFVLGTHDCDVKYAWGRIYFQALRAAGLNVCMKTPDEVMRNPPKVLYCVGDVRQHGESQYEERFVRWLMDEFRGTVLNSLHRDLNLGNKGLLLDALYRTDLGYLIGEGSRHLLTQEDINWSLEKVPGGLRFDHLVLKPDDGKSGEGVTFGYKEKRTTWRKKVTKARITQQYSLWEKQLLPMVNIRGQDLAMDLNPAFWVDVQSGVFEYMYTIARVQPWESYERQGTNNVATGAGFIAANRF